MKTSPAFVQLVVILAILMGLVLPAAGQGVTTLSEQALLDLNQDWPLNHQGTPMGVPKDYRWANGAYLEAGNQSGKFTALTGWGHAFWDKATLGHPGELEIRNFHTFLCSGTDRHWAHVQYGRIEGAEFRADFKGNAAKRPVKLSLDGNTATVLFDAGATFHFWPAGGRSPLPAGDLCGVVVLLEARATNSLGGSAAQTGGYLIGLGADYWIDMTSPWDNFKTNKGVGLGRLKHVGREWGWYGISTASDADLRRLYANGLMQLDR